MTPSILVIGGTGVIGSELMRELDGRANVRALVRSAASAETLAGRHPDIELLEGDLAEPGSLPHAFARVDRVFLLTPSVPDQRTLEENALDAALDSDIQRIVYMSNNEVGWGIELSRAHEATEQKLSHSEVPHTVLRPDYLFDNLLHELEALATGRLIAPTGGARCAFVDSRDVGAVAAAALLADQVLAGPLIVTGPQLMSWAELAERLSDALGAAIEHVDPDPTDWAVKATDAGMPPWLAAALREYFERLADEVPAVSDDILRTTGCPPRFVEDFARDKLSPALHRAGEPIAITSRREHA